MYVRGTYHRARHTQEQDRRLSVWNGAGQKPAGCKHEVTLTENRPAWITPSPSHPEEWEPHKCGLQLGTTVPVRPSLERLRQRTVMTSRASWITLWVPGQPGLKTIITVKQSKHPCLHIPHCPWMPWTVVYWQPWGECWKQVFPKGKWLMWWSKETAGERLRDKKPGVNDDG